MLIVPILIWLASLPVGRPQLYVGMLSLFIPWQLLSLYSMSLTPFYLSALVCLQELNGLLVCLSIWVALLMFLTSMNNGTFFDFLVGSLIIVVIGFFSVDHLLWFYILFEASLLPTLFLILKWGYQPERLQAGTYFIMYTICASLPLLIGILGLYQDTGHLNIFNSFPMPTFNFQISSYGVCCCLLTAFLVKVPIWGVHLWLPKAHVEAPVSGSMVLAGVLLNLGGYGLIQIYLLAFHMLNSSVYIFYAISLWGSLTVSMVCLRQTDIKSLIAYSSVIHIALIVLGILSGTWSGWTGAIIIMVAHGLSSPGLFALANWNYLSVGSRNLLLQKGISLLFPTSALLWFLLLMANMAAPPSLNLAAELLIFSGVLNLSWVAGLLLSFSTFMAAAYNLYLYSSQQSKPTQIFVPGSNWGSISFLVGILYITPVYGLILSLGCF